MIHHPAISLTALALLASPLLAQDPPRPQPAPEAPKPEPRKEDPRRDNPQNPQNPGNPQRDPIAGPPFPPPSRDGFGPGGPPPGGGPRGFQPRPPDDPRGERPDGERPPFPGGRGPEGFGRGSLPPGDRFGGGERFGQPERAVKSTPYIGVVTSAVPPALAAQLGLNEGFGLVVEDVLPESPAQAAGLQKYDVLKLVNDQQLIDPGHLSGLLRGLGKDAQVTITLIRKGQVQQATVKIGEKMLPERRPGADLQRRFGGFGLWPPQREPGQDPRYHGPQGADPEQMRRFQERMQRYQDEMRRYQEQLRLWQKDGSAPMPEPPPLPDFGAASGGAPAGPADLLREARPGGAPQLRLPQGDGVSIFATSRARIAMKDNDGELEIAMRDGQRMLTSKDVGGKVVFTGPIDTPEQRAAVPAPIRAKLEAIEAQQGNLAAGAAGERDPRPFPPLPQPLPADPEVQ